MLPDNLDEMMVECDCGIKMKRGKANKRNKNYYCDKCAIQESLDFFNDKAIACGIIKEDERITI